MNTDGLTRARPYLFFVACRAHIVYTNSMNTTVNIRIDAKTKLAANKALAKIGLDMSSAVKLFLHQVVTEQGLPFTPTRNPDAIRARWDAQIEDALKHGKRYSSGKEALADLRL